MGDGGGDQAGGGIHIDAGLPGEGAVDAGEVHGAHEPGVEHPLGHPVLLLQKGEQRLRAPVDVRAFGEDLVQGHVEAAVFIPGHAVRRLRQIAGEPGGHRRQILRGHLLRPDAGPVLKGVRVVAHPPEKAGEQIHPQADAHRPQDRAAGAAPPPLPGPDHSGDAPDDVADGSQGRQGVEHLHHGEGHPVGDGGQGPADRRGGAGLQGVHPGPVPPGQQKGRRQRQLRQQAEIQFSMGFEKCAHSHSAAASSSLV